MKISWLVIANSAEADIYDSVLHPNKPTFSLIKAFENNESRLKTSELADDQAGEFGSGTGGHAVYSHNNLHKSVIERFAIKIAKYLDLERGNHKFQRLFIAAEPSFLGLLFGSLSELTQELVAVKIDKNYISALNNKELTIEKILINIYKIMNNS